MTAQADKTEHSGRRGRTVFAVFAVVLFVTGLVYLPLLHAGFVWDDWVDFVYMPWLRYGNEWQHYILRDFNDWTSYFRPLVVGVFTLEVRAFSGKPEPMHAVSLVLHLINTLLVGLLAWKLSIKDYLFAENAHHWRVGLAMAAYGLHPASVEVVSWIGCQFELIVAFFILIGLLGNLQFQNCYTRALWVSACFFLAACSKEAAATFPLLVFVFDWIVLTRSTPLKVTRSGLLKTTYKLVRLNWPTYAACVLAGTAYLAFRHWALGQLIDDRAVANTTIPAHVRETAEIYVAYLKIIFWPMSGLSPIHPYNPAQFEAFSRISAISVLAAITVALSGVYFALRRQSIVGYIIVVATISLLPVLHILQINFDSSLYHERYALTALSLACPLLALIEVPRFIRRRDAFRILSVFLVAAWFFLSVINIGATVPLWSDNTRLWEWAVREYPDSIEAKDLLLGAYVNTGNMTKARLLGDQLVARRTTCSSCLLNAAMASAAAGDTIAASNALDLLQHLPALVTDKRLYKSYLASRGRILMLEDKPQEAENLLRAAANMDPLDPEPRYSLAIALGWLGKTKEAMAVGNEAIALSAPNLRSERLRVIERAVRKGQQVNLVQ